MNCQGKTTFCKMKKRFPWSVVVPDVLFVFCVSNLPKIHSLRIYLWECLAYSFLRSPLFIFKHAEKYSCVYMCVTLVSFFNCISPFGSNPVAGDVVITPSELALHSRVTTKSCILWWQLRALSLQGWVSICRTFLWDWTRENETRRL